MSKKKISIGETNTIGSTLLGLIEDQCYIDADPYTIFDKSFPNSLVINQSLFDRLFNQTSTIDKS
jgi:hypothetical protein